MKTLMLTLLVSISLFGCNEPPVLKKTCVPSSEFDKAYCNDYSLAKTQWVNKEFTTEPISVVDDAVCINREAFLKTLKPWVKDQDRRKRRKKKIIIDDFMYIRNIYEI